MQNTDIEGRWGLLSWRQEYDDGRVILPMGDKLSGFAEYRDGRVTIMVTDATRRPFTTGGQWDASEAEKARAYETGLFYAGTYRVEDDSVFHEIEIASFPNWVGGTQKRQARLEGDNLQLIARLEEGSPEARRAILEWQRLA
ncbi:MAG: lipocalin-like domain-containing protein [Gammaproteobacteria bacterium]|nr:lipocalin-like domain-containing protein [Gammaproteobacteria bacterium]